MITKGVSHALEVIKAAFPAIHEPPSSDICYATTNRQTAVRAIAPEAGFVLVVGSRNSSNSVRLTEIALNDGTPSRLIDDADGIDPAWFEGIDTVLVTSGASVPEDLVHGVIERLIERFGGEVEQRDPPVGAGDGERAVAKDDVRLRRFERVGRNPASLLDQIIDGAHDRSPGRRRRARGDAR